MDGTDPRYVHLLYDTGHAYISDGDYMTILNKHMDRIRHVHFKDARFDIMERCRQEGKSFRQSFYRAFYGSRRRMHRFYRSVPIARPS